MTTASVPAHSPGSAPAPIRRRTRPRPALWVLVFPFVVMFVLFFVAPIVFALVQSMFATRSSGLGLGAPETVFVFLENYARAFGDPAFVASLGRLLVFSLIEVPLMVFTRQRGNGIDLHRRPNGTLPTRPNWRGPAPL